MSHIMQIQLSWIQMSWIESNWVEILNRLVHVCLQPQNNTVFSTMKPFPSAVPYSMVPQWLARFLAIGKPPKPVDDWNDLSTNGFATLPGSSIMKFAIILEDKTSLWSVPMTSKLQDLSEIDRFPWFVCWFRSLFLYLISVPQSGVYLPPPLGDRPCCPIQHATALPHGQSSYLPSTRPSMAH